VCVCAYELWYIWYFNGCIVNTIQSNLLLILLNIFIYLHICIYHSRYPQRGSRHISDNTSRYQNDLVVKNAADATCGKSIAVWLQSISGVSAVNSLVAFYNIHERKGEVLFFCSFYNTFPMPVYITVKYLY
jgi:hypothetical protein